MQNGKDRQVKFRRSVTVAALAGVAAATGLALGAGVAFAAAPPFEPDPNSVISGSPATVALYDSSGNQITSGSISSKPIAAYAVASTTIRSGDTSAILRFAQPNPNSSTTLYSKDDPGGFTAYPITTGPANIQTLSQTHPVATGKATDLSLADEIAAFPNTGPGGAGCPYSVGNPAGCTNTQYQNVYQLRVVTAAGASQSSQYATMDVVVSGTTWTQVYPTVAAATTTTLTSSQNPTVTGTSITLTATETPATAGSVQFKDGATNLGSPVAVNGSGVATLNTSFSTTGAHNLSAVFTPTDTSGFASSTGTLTETLNPPATPTTTSLAVTQDGTAGHPITLTATVTPSAAAGSLDFFDNGSTTAIPGTVNQSPAGTYTLSLPSGLAAGSHSVVAKFRATDVTQFQASQSSAQAFVLQPPAVGACAQTASQCTAASNIQVTVPTGTLVISTPYTAASPLDLGTMVLNSSAQTLSASAPFNNIQITDTRSGNLPYAVTALATNLSDGGSNPGSQIDAHNVGLTGLATTTTGSGFTGTPVYTNHAAQSPPVAPGGASTAGLGGSAQTIIAVDHGLGVLTANGLLTINAPASTEPGTFTGTITLTVG